jgi:hypothetical protein
MLKEVDKVIWNEEINGRYVSIFNQAEYLQTISHVHKTKLKFFIFYHKNEAIIGFAAHIKRHKVIIPDHYSYSSFWIKDSLGEFSRFDFIDLMLKELKLKFESINFRLPPNIYDVRAFNLNGFDTKVKYTYINKTENISLRKNLSYKYQKSKNLDFLFSFDKYYEESLKQQVNDFTVFGFSKAQKIFYQNYFKNLIDKGYLKCFSIKIETNLIASALILIDFNKSTAYNLMLSSSKTNYSLESSTFLYVKMMEKLDELGIKLFDLYGADMKGIANYKSGFCGELKPHYLLEYGLTQKLKERFLGFKLFIKKLVY